MKAPSGDTLPARGASKVTQMVILNNPNKVGSTHTDARSFWSVKSVTANAGEDNFLANEGFYSKSQMVVKEESTFTLRLSHLSHKPIFRADSVTLSKSFFPLQVNLKMRVRVSYSRQGAAFQDTVQIDSFPGLGAAGH